MLVDVLARNGFFPPVGDVNIENSPSDGLSSIIDISVTKYGIYTLLDAKRNKLFTYDANGNLLNAFGGTGEQKGLFRNAISIDYKDDQLLVLDTASGRITIFDRTAYGDQIYSAIGLYKERKYAEANQQWSVILEQNGNLDLAYIGVGKSLMMSEQYQSAMDYFRKANDVSDYSKAYKQYRDQIIRKYILIFALVVGLVVFLWKMWSGYVKKRNDANSYKTGGFTIRDELFYAFYVIFHPFAGFWEMKCHKRGTWKGAGIILGLLCGVMLLKPVATGYIFNSSVQQGNYNLLSNVVVVLLPFGLWCVANWCLTSLLEGEGNFSNIIVTTSYSFTPYIMMMVLAIICSNFLTLEEQVVYQFFTGLGMLWSIFLLFIGMLVIHDYSLAKNIGMVVLTVVGMLVILFLGVLFVNLLQLMYNFFAGVLREITFRL